MKNVQKPEKIHLGKLIEEIRKGRFVIPDFQREFDWEPWDVRDLIKSIFMDYYIGTLLLWEGNKENYKKLSCAPLYAFEAGGDPEYIVLDGQQRLSALHYALFQPDVKFRKRKNAILYFIRLNELLEENFEEAFFYYSKTKYYGEIIDNTTRQYEEHLFPIGMMKEGSWGIDDWIKGYRDYWQDKADACEEAEMQEQCEQFARQAKDLKELFSDLLNNYQISYISLDRDLELNKVCDIFTHINSKGKPLDTFDLLNSITRKEDIYLKDMYREASVQLDDATFPGFEIKTYLMMVMSIMKQNYCSSKYLYYLVPHEKKKIKNKEGKVTEVVLINSKEEFIDLWQKAVKAIDKALSSLKNPRDFGSISSKFLPYPSIIPCLAAIKAYVEQSELRNKVDIHSKIRKWYWSSIFQNRYSSSVESTSAKDYMDLKKWFVDEDSEPDAYTDFVAGFRDLDLHKETRNGSAIYKAIFNIFILNEAKDWETFELPEYDTLDDHHIVPKSWGKKMGLGQEINTVLNKTPLSSDTNRKIIRDNLPNTYLKSILENNDEEKVYKVLQSHLISRKAIAILLRDPFTVEDYRDFISERKHTILQEIEGRLINEKIDLPENLKMINDEIEKVELRLRSIIKSRCLLASIEDIKTKIPNHFLPKLKGRIEKEVRKNPSLRTRQDNDVDFWIQFLDLQELKDIIQNKDHWSSFETEFVTKEKLTGEFNDLAALRNAIRHSREADQITRMKGEASILWFKQQLKLT